MIVAEQPSVADLCVPIARQAEELGAFLQPDCPAVLWQRTLLPKFQSWIDQLAPENLPHGRLILRPDGISGAVEQLCDMAGTPLGPERDLFINDTSMLGEVFAKLMSAEYVQLRLERVIDNSCFKFHKDAIRARLVCTYRGTGTQYGVSTDAEDPTDVFTSPTGSPLLLRGSLWPERTDSGLKHRSPPIKGTGETRLVFVLDPVCA